MKKLSEEEKKPSSLEGVLVVGVIYLLTALITAAALCWINPPPPMTRPGAPREASAQPAALPSRGDIDF